MNFMGSVVIFKFKSPGLMIVIALVIAPNSAMSVNKCTSADGKISYQDMPCAQSDQAGNISIAPSKDGLEKQRSERALRAETERRRAEVTAEAELKARKDREYQEVIEKSSRETEQEFRKAEKSCGKPVEEAPLVGMTEERFLRCTAPGLFGRHTVNETVTAAGVTKQYVFRDNAISAVRYVYVRNGVVTAIQR